MSRQKSWQLAIGSWEMHSFGFRMSWQLAEELAIDSWQLGNTLISTQTGKSFETRNVPSSIPHPS